jgi:hypothetical protein
MSVATTNLAYFWGEDAWGMERAVRRMAIVLGGSDGTGEGLVESATPWRSGASMPKPRRAVGSARPLASWIGSPSAWAPRRSSEAARWSCSASRRPSCARRRSRTARGLIGDVPPGNALAVTELADGGSRPSKAAEGLREAVKRAWRHRP